MDNTERRTILVARWPLVICLALVVAMPGWSAAQSRFSAIVVFGTSLSDPGNAFALEGDASAPPDFLLNPLLIPSAPYAKGGHHFSNGATWIEQFARSVGLGDSVAAALATTDPAVTNFAVGAARAYNDGAHFNLSRQVDAFLQRSGGVASPQALYVIEMGSNDIRDAFVVYAGGGNGGPVLGAALGSIATAIQRVYAAGGRQFLVWAAPNVALTPAITSLGPGARSLATSLTLGFNGNLNAIVGQLSAGLPGISITRLPADQILDSIVTTPEAFDLSDVVTPCITPSVAPFACQHADSYLFWDGIHPTKAGHAILAQQAASVLP